MCGSRTNIISVITRQLIASTERLVDLVATRRNVARMMTDYGVPKSGEINAPVGAQRPASGSDRRDGSSITHDMKVVLV
jgi:hypothetical protein